MSAAESDDTLVVEARARSRRRAVIAAVAGAALVLLGLVVLLGPRALWSGTSFEVDFAFAGPIKPGASVRISGIVVGSVANVRLLGAAEAGDKPGAVRVKARVEPDAARLISDRAQCYVTTLGVLGEYYLDVAPHAGGTPIAEGARLTGVALPRPDLLLPRAAGLLERVDALVPESPELAQLVKQLTTFVARMDGLLARDSAGAADDEIAAMWRDVRTVLHGVAVSVGDGESLKRAVERAPIALERGERLANSVDAIVTQGDVVALLQDLRRTVGRANSIAERVEQSPLLAPAQQQQLTSELLKALDAIDRAGHRADRLMAVVEEKRGGAGKLFWDEAVAADLKSLLNAMRKDPIKLLLRSGD